jgi:adenylate kinase
MAEKRLPNIVVTGTPGVGKTSLSILLTDQLNEKFALQLSTFNRTFQYINVGKLVVDKKLYKDWNEDFDVPEFDDNMIINELTDYIPDGGYILDFHSSYFFPEDWVDLVVLIRCNNTVLFDRLKERGYTEKKIKENIECEILEVTADDVYENYDKNKVIELHNEKVEDMQTNIDEIINFLAKNF